MEKTTLTTATSLNAHGEASTFDGAATRRVAHAAASRQQASASGAPQGSGAYLSDAGG